MSPVTSGRQLRQWLYQAHNQHVAGLIDHADVVTHVREDGAFRARYAFMTLMACGIATLGLLLSSPAVIIGAMLISPLMGPIVLFGFSLCLLDLKAMRRSLVALTVGTALAVATSYVIVRISPITQATPEILARTHPNLFDLLVAVFSGLAGGYAVIRRKGETIVGVAIATALMPPLCVVGYGLAAGAPSVAMGAGFLFMTNLLAIALSVTLLAKFFGFGADQSPTHTVWQTLLILATFGALSVPLGVALTRIAIEAQMTNAARAAVSDYFEDDDARVSDFDVAFGDQGQIRVDAVVLTHAYRPEAHAQLLDELGRRLGRPVNLGLDQVLVDQDRALEESELLRRAESSLTGPLRAELSKYQRRDTLETELRNAASFKVDSVDVESNSRTIRIFAAPSPFLELSAYMETEHALATRYPDWHLQVIPSVRSLPPILFDGGSAELDSAADRVIDAIAWTLRRWQVENLTVVGFASTAGEARRFDNTSLAYKRAMAVGQRLVSLGFVVNATSEYPGFGQEQAERAAGQRSYQRVDVRPGETLAGLDLGSDTTGSPADAATQDTDGQPGPDASTPPVPVPASDEPSGQDTAGQPGPDAAVPPVSVPASDEPPAQDTVSTGGGTDSSPVEPAVVNPSAGDGDTGGAPPTVPEPTVESTDVDNIAGPADAAKPDSAVVEQGLPPDPVVSPDPPEIADTIRDPSGDTSGAADADASTPDGDISAGADGADSGPVSGGAAEQSSGGAADDEEAAATDSPESGPAEAGATSDSDPDPAGGTAEDADASQSAVTESSGPRAD